MDDAHIFCKPYKYIEVKRGLIKAQIEELLDAKLIEFFNREHAIVTIMSSKINIFNNWIKKQMYGDYRPINKRKKSNRYAMPISKIIFDIIEYVKIFNTLDL